MKRPYTLSCALDFLRPSARRFASALTGVGAAVLFTSLAQAQVINDVPMSVKNNVPPNFMFMIDNSGSMTNVVPTAPYNPAVTYPVGSCSNVIPAGSRVDIRIATVDNVRRSFIRYGGNNYRHSTQVNTNRNSPFGSNDTRCFNATAEYDAHLLASANGNTTPPNFLPSVYTGNYLNWYFGTTCSGTLAWSGSTKPVGTCGGAVQSRMEIAIEAGKNMVDTLQKPISATADTAVRVGLSTYRSANSGDGGTMLVPIKNLSFNDSDDTITHIGRTPLKAAIDALTPEGNTPLAETLADIGRYLATGYNGNIATANDSAVNIDTFFKQNGRKSCLYWGSTSSRSGCENGSETSNDHSRRPPVTQWCQRSYVFMLTDGRSNQDLAFSDNTYLRDYDRDCSGALASTCVSNGAAGSYDRKRNRDYESAGSDYLDDVAKALFDIDLRPDIVDPRTSPLEPKKNNARTYVIGFADAQVQDDPLLIAAAAQGGGKFIAASDNVALQRALGEVVTDAFRQDAAAAAVAVANPQITVSDISYAPSYNSGGWYGDLEAYRLDTTSGAQIRPRIWSARELLNDRVRAQGHTDRKIATFNGTVGKPFRSGQFTAPSSLTTDVINYVRGDRSRELLDGSGLRVREHLLGDIINAEPVVMNYPNPSGTGGDVPIVFQAANDGMLHAFDGRVDSSITTRGQELWAYVPRAVHSHLAELSGQLYAHRYYVDATPSVAQVTGLGSMTRMLVGGLGKGGGAYYALDISSFGAADEAAAAAKVKWEFTHQQMGYSFGSPLIVNTAAGWRVVVSSGYGNVTGGPNGNGDGRGRVWVLNPADGAVLGTIDTGVGSSTNPAGLAHLSKSANTAADAQVRYVYGGDLLGNVWRFDITDFTVAPLRIATLRDPSGAVQPITAPIEVGPVTGQPTRNYLYVGTGKYLSDSDVPGNAGATAAATQRQSIYGLIDDTSAPSPAAIENYRGTNGAFCPNGGGNGVLTCQRLDYQASNNRYRATTHTVSATARGWYVDFPPATGTGADTRLGNGRVIGKPVITTGGTMAFTLNVPSAAKCDPGGSSWFFQLAGQSGGAVRRVAGGNEFYDAGIFLGHALASRVVVIQTAGTEEGDKVGLIQLSNREVVNLPIGEEKTNLGPAASWRRVYWRQLK